MHGVRVGQGDEVELRQVWISLVYLTLQTIAHPRKRKDSLSIATPFEDKFLGAPHNHPLKSPTQMREYGGCVSHVFVAVYPPTLSLLCPALIPR
eukprot:1091529-Rhodomonas_salina.1